MPCNSDHMNPTETEREYGRIELMLAELDTGVDVDSAEYRRACKYNVTKAELDKLTATLCSRLSQHKALSLRSLEIQIWWRDHQIADQKRIAQEQKDAANETARKAALAKLTPAERKLLGLK